MSRWSTEFAQHPLQQLWAQLKTELANVEIDDQTVTTAVQELARLKRVIAYLDAMLENIDPELTPKSVWQNFHGQVEPCLQNVRAYVSNKNINQIVRANEHADNLLTYLRPYEVLPQAVVQGLGAASRSLVADIEGYARAFRDKADALVRSIEEDKTASASFLQSAHADHGKVAGLVAKLFGGTEEAPGVASRVDSLLEKATANELAIRELHAALLIGTAQAPSTQARIAALDTNIQETRTKVDALLNGAEAQLKELDAFHEKIFGKKDATTAQPTGGLAQELETRTEHLRAFEEEQGTKYRALNEQIESLLPGATSAGLGSAYRTLKESFTGPIRTYTRLFYLSIASLVVGALVMVTESASVVPPAIDFVKIAEWDEILKALLYKAPFVAPVIWVALFSAKRRSQYERLQQEYAHKEALARSYQSYKKQLQELKVESEELQRELLAKAIDAISYNASVTLDGKHDEKLPLQQLLDKFSVEDLKKLLDLARKKEA